jgi:hypothetical protein
MSKQVYSGRVCEHQFKFPTCVVEVFVSWELFRHAKEKMYHVGYDMSSDTSLFDWRGVIKARLDDAILWFSLIVSHINKLPTNMNPILDDLGLHENAGVITLAV